MKIWLTLRFVSISRIMSPDLISYRNDFNYGSAASHSIYFGCEITQSSQQNVHECSRSFIKLAENTNSLSVSLNFKRFKCCLWISCRIVFAAKWPFQLQQSWYWQFGMLSPSEHWAWARYIEQITNRMYRRYGWRTERKSCVRNVTSRILFGFTCTKLAGELN